MLIIGNGVDIGDSSGANYGKFFVCTSVVHKDEGTIDISYNIDGESSAFDIKIDNAVDLEFLFDLERINN